MQLYLDAIDVLTTQQANTLPKLFYHIKGSDQ
jgi:hypothetical protein